MTERIDGDIYTYSPWVHRGSGEWTTVPKKMNNSRKMRVRMNLYRRYLRDLTDEECRNKQIRKEIWSLACENEKNHREELEELKRAADLRDPVKAYRRQERSNKESYSRRLKRSGRYVVKIEEALTGVMYTPEEMFVKAEWKKRVRSGDSDVEEPEELFEARMRAMTREIPLDGRELMGVKYGHQNWEPVIAHRHGKSERKSESGSGGKKVLHGMSTLDKDSGKYKSRRYEKSYIAKVRRCREKMGLSQKEAALLTDVPESEYRKFENGELMYNERLKTMLTCKLVEFSEKN